MKNRLQVYLLFFLLGMFACQKKDIDFKKGEYELAITDASYFFDGTKYSSGVEPFRLILTSYSATELNFTSRILHSFGHISEENSQLQVSGNQIQGVILEYSITGNSEIENKKRVIKGDVTFTKVHDYLCIDGPFSYPCTAQVDVSGKFSINPVWN